MGRTIYFVHGTGVRDVSTTMHNCGITPAGCGAGSQISWSRSVGPRRGTPAAEHLCGVAAAIARRDHRRRPVEKIRQLCGICCSPTLTPSCGFRRRTQHVRRQH